MSAGDARGNPPRRFRVHYGQHDGAGYVVCDSAVRGADWRGKVMFKTDNKGEAAAEADRLNNEGSK